MGGPLFSRRTMQVLLQVVPPCSFHRHGDLWADVNLLRPGSFSGGTLTDCWVVFGVNNAFALMFR